MQPPKNPVLTASDAVKILRRQRGAEELPLPEPNVDPSIHKETAQLRALIRQHRRPYQVQMHVTQSMALAMLAMMGVNRRPSPSRIAAWETVLREGRFEDSIQQGMAFDTNGHLRDGQHRLIAVANTRIAIDVWVLFGMRPEAFSVIDTGYKRTAGQNLGLDNIKGAGTLAAMVRMRYRTEHEGMLPDDGLVFTLGHEMADEDDVLARSLICAARLRKKKRGTTTSALALAYWLIAKQSKRKLSIDEFWDHLVDGHEISKTNPIFRVRERLDEFVELDRKVVQYQSQTEQAAFIILAWNAWVKGVPVATRRKWPTWDYVHQLPPVE